jgi:hypothetical protein
LQAIELVEDIGGHPNPVASVASDLRDHPGVGEAVECAEGGAV